MTKLRLLLTAAAAHLSDLLAVAALLAIGVGCWLERPSLGLIVPGFVVFVSLALSRLGGR